MYKSCWIMLSFVWPTFTTQVMCLWYSWYRWCHLVLTQWGAIWLVSLRSHYLGKIPSFFLHQEMMNERKPPHTEQNIILTFVTEVRPLSDMIGPRGEKVGLHTQTRLLDCCNIAQQQQNVSFLLDICIIWMVIFSLQSHWKYLSRWVLKVEWKECPVIFYELLWCFSMFKRPRGCLWNIGVVQFDESLLLHSNMQVSSRCLNEKKKLCIPQVKIPLASIKDFQSVLLPKKIEFQVFFL